MRRASSSTSVSSYLLIFVCIQICFFILFWTSPILQSANVNRFDIFQPNTVTEHIASHDDPPLETIEHFGTENISCYRDNYLSLLHATTSPIISEKRFLRRSIERFVSAQPFPHIIFENIFPVSIVSAVSLEVHDTVNVNPSNNCVKGSTVCIRDAIQQGKSAYNDEKYFGPATIAMFSYLRSSRFTFFLEKLTNISFLVPDPHYLGSGIHQTVRGGYLKIHSDSNYLHKKLHRRVNLFLFLNSDWDDSYGGHLELWSRDLRYCHQRISPSFGKLVIFACTDYSYHGHQTPLSCPPVKSRRSLALYYYSLERPNEECYDNDCARLKTGGDSNTTVVETFCSSCGDQDCRKW